jgi:hypothetical protein
VDDAASRDEILAALESGKTGDLHCLEVVVRVHEVAGGL